MSITVNKIPSPTWRWLKMNESAAPDARIAAVEAIAADKKRLRDMARLAEIAPTGLGREADEFFASGGLDVILDNDAKREYVTSDKNEAQTVVISVPAGSERTVVQTVTGDGSGAFGLKTVYAVGEGARLTIAQVIMSGSGAVLNDIGGAVDDGGELTLQQIFIGSGDIYAASDALLEGKKAAIKAEVAYHISGEGRLDMNYIADHTGKKTNSELNVNGVLFDRAHKLFRGTIDFKRGCGGAVGAELEDVLLMDEAVRNQTIPVILCKEEDVEGSHGASIGRLDEELLFYLTSRGIGRDAVYKMMATARIDALRKKLPDEGAAKIVADKLGIAE